MVKQDIGQRKIGEVDMSKERRGEGNRILLKYAFRRIIMDSIDLMKPTAVLKCMHLGAFKRWATFSWDFIEADVAATKNRLQKVVNFLRYSPFDQDVVSVFH